MEINDDTVRHLLKLSHLKVSMEEAQELRAGLQEMVNYADMIQECDLSALKEIKDAPSGRLREDRVLEVMGREALKNSPYFDGTYITVPQIVE